MALLPLDGGFLRQVAPVFSGARAAAQQNVIDAVGPVFAETLAAYAIDTALRAAHFTAQVAHECAGFRTVEEFASGAAYEGRLDLGNRWPGDGERFKGRGLLQLTGRANYRRMGERLGLALEEKPELAAEPRTSLRIACAYWAERRINDPADADDLPGVTRRVNGGLNGLEERRAYLSKAKAALAKLAAAAEEAPSAMPVLRRGASGEAVARLQARLREKGFALSLDSRFGPATERAAKAFQGAAGLVPDGVVGKQTWTALQAGADAAAAHTASG